MLTQRLVHTTPSVVPGRDSVGPTPARDYGKGKPVHSGEPWRHFHLHSTQMSCRPQRTDAAVGPFPAFTSDGLKVQTPPIYANWYLAPQLHVVGFAHFFFSLMLPQIVLLAACPFTPSQLEPAAFVGDLRHKEDLFLRCNLSVPKIAPFITNSHQANYITLTHPDLICDPSWNNHSLGTVFEAFYLSSPAFRSGYLSSSLSPCHV
jgi:hypothetical protein